jgi:hypothetical protein
MSELPPSHPCPICANPVPHWERYPLAVCPNCDRKACNDRGQKLVFFNLSLSGGFGARVADTEEDYPSHICYIEGKKCWADEARFGGIVIQPHTTQPINQEGLPD